MDSPTQAASAWPPLDLVVIGAQKAGTTFLRHLLGQHPEIYLCADEVPIFEDPYYERSDPAELRAALGEAAPGQRLGIERPDYLARPEVAPRLQRHTPEAKLIAVLRDPVPRAVSAYCWYVQYHLLPVRPVEEGMAALLDGWDGGARHPRAREVLEYGRYGWHLERWLEHFRREQLLVVTTDSLSAPDMERDLYRFVGVDDTHRAEPDTSRANVGVYEPRRLRVARFRARFGFSWDSTDRYTYRPRRWRRPISLVPSVALRLIDQHLLLRLWGNEPPRLSPELRSRLEAHYAADRDGLVRVLGRDPGWGTA